MNAAVIELEGTVRRYGSVEALGGLSLSIAPGEVVGLLGHNGAGKSTTMKLLLGVIAPTAGSVRVFGESPTSPRAQTLRRGLGYLPENVSFYESLGGREALLYFARLKGAGRRQCEELLERVGLADAADRRIKTYSKGMRQRLGLAQALLGDPGVLLLDEPTVGLDPLATHEFYETIDALRRKGTTIVLSSHVLGGIEPRIDRAVILRGGRLQAEGTIDELRREAGLPLLIEVQGEWGEEPWQGFGAAVQVERCGPGRVTIRGALADKIDLTRRVLAHPGVSDFRILEPSLEALYSYYGSAPYQEGPR